MGGGLDTTGGEEPMGGRRWEEGVGETAVVKTKEVSGYCKE